MFVVPIGMELESVRSLNHSKIVSCTPHKLQSNGKICFREPAGHRKGGKAAEIADAAERIRKREVGLQVGLERRSGNGLGGSHQDVIRIKKCFHLFLQNLTDALRSQIVSGRILFVDVARELPQGIC